MCGKSLQLYLTLCDPILCPWGVSRQEYWSGLPCPPQNFPDPGIEPMSLMSPALASRFFTTSKKVRRGLSNPEYEWGRNNEKKGRKRERIKRVKELSEFNVEKAMAPHSSSLAWKIPWTEEPGRLQSRARLSDFTFAFHFHALEKEMATHSSVLAWRIPETEEPSRLPSVGSHRVGHD